jgi:hypothetical protein
MISAPPAPPAPSIAIFSLHVESSRPFFETLNDLVSLRVDDPTITSVAITQLSQAEIFFALVQQRTELMQVTCVDVVRWFTATFPGADITFAVAPNAILPGEQEYRLLNLTKPS